MKKEDISLAAQILVSMRNTVDQMEDALRRNNLENAAILRKQLLDLQANIAKLI
jgi:protein-arginine kinase activator protein McsA